MSQNVPLPARQLRAVAALVAGESIVKAAHAASVTRRTLTRWLATETFVAAVKTAREAAFAATLHAIELGAAEGVATLRRLNRITPKRAVQLGRAADLQLKAASRLVVLGVRAHEDMELRQEIDELRDRL